MGKDPEDEGRMEQGQRWSRSVGEWESGTLSFSPPFPLIGYQDRELRNTSITWVRIEWGWKVEVDTPTFHSSFSLD